MNKRAISALAAASMCLSSVLLPLNTAAPAEFSASAVSISDFPEEYQYAADWIWTNRIEREKSTERRNTIFDQIDAGKGTINYVVKWQSYRTVTYEQRQQFEKMLSDSINVWNDWLAGYDGWKYDHIDVKVVGWAVIDKSCLLDLHDDEIVYTDTRYYDAQYDTSNGRDTIPDKEPYAPLELSRFEHFTDSNYEYPGGLDKRFDMYMWATQGFPDIGGCGGDWGQRLSDTAYLNMIDGSGIHVLEHEIGHGFGMTDFYGGEGEADGFPPGGFPGGRNSIMMAGSAAEITDFDGWMLRYMWSKIKNDEGRFDLSTPEMSVSIKGDINADGIFNIADVVLLQNWLLARPDAVLADWKAADFCNDERLDVFDLCLMKRLLLTDEQPVQEEIPVHEEQQSNFITANMAKHGASLPTQGNAKMVVFYVDFPDCKYDYTPSTDELNSISFGAADDTDPCYPFESFSAFYGRASKGAMNLDGQVFRYTTKENQSVYDDNKVKIAEECYEAFRDKVDFSQFDGNGDGRIDATLFTVPEKAGTDHWWPCAGAFGDPNYRVDGMSIGHIITGNAQIGSTADHINYTSSYCHELGHCTGLPDYYLFTNPNDSEGMHGTAGIELMDTDAGSDFGAFSKLIEGWYREDQVQIYDASNGTQTFTLNNAQTDSGNCIIIPNGRLADDYFSEFFIVEYATKDGNNSGIGTKTAWWAKSGEGVRIYHIDAATEYGWNTYFRYASGSEFTNQDKGRRLIRVIDDVEKDNLYHTGDVINGSISGFRWYDSNGGQTVETGLTITIGELKDGKYAVTIG
ncbi:dockerin type I domain-containing protein [uncultured Ruminococcus sp.]|uniref:dockerin type I domain-containing protein n=1 Tax=uncultured Ruminococcus sp. TaxID=165186 RepID=UPI0026321B7C|nr:dockerin type I domain-containing protein [uncultured Ruminococcus sp.]